MTPAVRWSSRVYRLLVRAYPSQFGNEYTDEMVWCFEDMCRAALNKRGTSGLIMLWLQIVPDWCFTVIKEHLLNNGYQGANIMDYTQFNSQLTSTLALFTRALRSGYNVKQSVEIIIDHAPEPTKSAFQSLLEKIEGGTSWDEAFAELSGELKSNEFDKVIDVVNAQRAEGGNLADKLDDVTREIYKDLGDTGWAKEVDLEDGYLVAEHYPVK